jgi:hypothetical protein
VEYNSGIFGVVFCDVLRDLARDVERKEIIENDVRLAGEAAQRAPMRAMWKSESSRFKNPSKTFFSQEKIFICSSVESAERASHT